MAYNYSKTASRLRLYRGMQLKKKHKTFACVHALILMQSYYPNSVYDEYFPFSLLNLPQDSCAA